MTKCDRNICYRQDYNGGCENCPCNTDVPEINVGKITTKQAIEAINTIKEYCKQRDGNAPCYGCPLWDWCKHDRDVYVPEIWDIPQERTEE